MPNARQKARIGTDRGLSIVRDLAGEVEAARLEHGTSYAEIGRAIGVGGGQAARICRGRSPGLTIVRASQLLARAERLYSKHQGRIHRDRRGKA